jgi:hypothetical protein
MVTKINTDAFNKMVINGRCGKIDHIDTEKGYDNGYYWEQSLSVYQDLNNEEIFFVVHSQVSTPEISTYILNCESLDAMKLGIAYNAANNPNWQNAVNKVNYYINMGFDEYYVNKYMSNIIENDFTYNYVTHNDSDILYINNNFDEINNEYNIVDYDYDSTMLDF